MPFTSSQLGPMDCMNQLVEVGVQGLQFKALRIDLSADASVDALLLHKMIKDGAETHRMGAAVQQNAASTLQIQQDLNMAEQESVCMAMSLVNWLATLLGRTPSFFSNSSCERVPLRRVIPDTAGN
jgi:hypothetical protein